MRLAILAPLVEPVPPPLYGGTERVVSVLTEELVRRGHDVTLFASGDSQTSATLVATHPVGLRLDPQIRDYVASMVIHVGEAYRHANLTGILSVVRTGGSWREVPEACGKWETAYKRYRLWQDTGVWSQILAALEGGKREVSL